MSEETVSTTPVEETTPAVEKKENKEELLAKALELMTNGKRNVLCQDVLQAVNQFQEATQILASAYGETANQCGDAYLCYGKALLEVSRMENGVLGNALQGIDSEDEEEEEEESEKSSQNSDDKIEDPEKISEEEREKIAKKVYKAMGERKEEKKARLEKERKKAAEETKDGEATEKTGEEKEKQVDEEMETSGSSDTSEDEKEEKENMEEGEGQKDAEAESEELVTEEEAEGEEKKTEGEDSAKDTAEKEKNTDEGETSEKKGENATDGGETSEKKEGDEKKEEEEEDVSNLQLAWEVLELSKIIFKRDSSKESRLKLSEVHLKLGEVALETEQYDTAVGDFKECLKIQKDLLDAEDRCLAETHYQLGLAHTFACQYDDAIANYKSAASVIEAKIKTLDKIIEDGEKEGKGKDIADFEDPVYKAHKEIAELKDLLPEMLAKIEDVLEEQKTAEEAKKMVKEAVGLQSGSGDAATPSTSGSSNGVQTSSGTGDQPTNVITHLVRKKRKNEEEESDEAKKTKVENGEGDAAAATVNGTA